MFQQFDCADETGMSEVKQRVGDMEAVHQKLEQQDRKYSAELTTALTEYTALVERAESVDPEELSAARQTVRPDKELEVAKRLQVVYGQWYDSQTMAQSREDIAALLGEETEARSVRELLRQKQQPKQKQQQPKKTKSHEQER